MSNCHLFLEKLRKNKYNLRQLATIFNIKSKIRTTPQTIEICDVLLEHLAKIGSKIDILTIK